MHACIHKPSILTLITLHYMTLHCIALRCMIHYLHYIALHCIPLNHITLHYISLHIITLHYITVHYITLHYITLHCITLHYITSMRTYIHTYFPKCTNTYAHEQSGVLGVYKFCICKSNHMHIYVPAKANLHCTHTWTSILCKHRWWQVSEMARRDSSMGGNAWASTPNRKYWAAKKSIRNPLSLR